MANRTAQIHRFRDKVGVHLPGARETVYLNAEDAQTVADAMVLVVREIAHVDFTESTVGTKVLSIKQEES